MILGLSQNLKKEMDFESLFIICFIIPTINSIDYRENYDEYERRLYETGRDKECKKEGIFKRIDKQKKIKLLNTSKILKEFKEFIEMLYFFHYKHEFYGQNCSGT
jgi:hypothetical protein